MQNGNGKPNPQKLGLKLPPDLELESLIGTGSCGPVYKVHFQGETLALKAYTQQAIQRYEKKHGANLAIFEMSQNRSLRKLPQLLPFTAKPNRVLGQDGKFSLCFLQEFVDGVSIDALAERLGRLPQSLLEAGEVIDQVSRTAGIKGMDQFMRDILVRERHGVWQPVMFDFKHVPREHGGSKPLFGILGRKHKAGSAFLRQWRELAARLEKASG